MRNIKRLKWIGVIAGIVSVYVASAQSDTGKGLFVGQLKVDAASTIYRLGNLIYKMAHMTGQNGMTLDADDLEVALKTHNAQMVGHVKGHFSKTADSEDITVESDKATYNQTTNQIDLSGNVKVTIYSLYTDGPLVQTGDSATVQLGAAPTYPLITMNHVHATFTPGH